MMPNLTNTENN